MAQLNPVKIPNNTWVDLYSETGITIGVQIVIQNIGSSSVRLAEQVSAPIASDGYNLVEPVEFVSNRANAVGAWAFSGRSTLLQVDEL